jgi:group I intron endonuclease
MAVIYRITNMANDNYYIGSAESFVRRQWQHKYDLKRGTHKNPKLQAAWNKYGEDMFVFEVIEEVPDDRTAFDIENTYLMKCVGQPDCYNINTDAHVPRLGIPHTEKTKQLIKVNRKGKSAGENHYRYGTTLSEEVRKKIGDTQRGIPKGPGRKVSEEGKAKIAAAAAAGHYSHWEGRQHTEEAKAKMRRPVYAILPDGTRRDFEGTALAGEALGVPYPMLVRSMKAGKPISRGKLAGWFFAYADAPAALPEEVAIPEEFKDLPRTRQAAKDAGAPMYFTGLPCTHGHVSPRLTKGACVACRKAGFA